MPALDAVGPALRAEHERIPASAADEDVVLGRTHEDIIAITTHGDHALAGQAARIQRQGAARDLDRHVAREGPRGGLAHGHAHAAGGRPNQRGGAQIEDHVLDAGQGGETHIAQRAAALDPCDIVPGAALDPRAGQQVGNRGEAEGVVAAAAPGDVAGPQTAKDIGAGAGAQRIRARGRIHFHHACAHRRRIDEQARGAGRGDDDMAPEARCGHFAQLRRLGAAAGELQMLQATHRGEGGIGDGLPGGDLQRVEAGAAIGLAQPRHGRGILHHQHVLAGATPHDVGAALPDQPIIAGPAQQRVAAGGAVEHDAAISHRRRIERNARGVGRREGDLAIEGARGSGPKRGRHRARGHHHNSLQRHLAEQRGRGEMADGGADLQRVVVHAAIDLCHLQRRKRREDESVVPRPTLHCRAAIAGGEDIVARPAQRHDIMRRRRPQRGVGAQRPPVHAQQLGVRCADVDDPPLKGVRIGGREGGRKRRHRG